jgi:alkylation response protein AidB-like acyl-CoA dehydrogenase
MQGQHMIPGQVALRRAGFEGIPGFNIEGVCASSSTAMHLAAQAVKAEACDIAMVVEAGERADKECAMAKWYGTEIPVDATRQAVQIHSGNGITKEFIVERLAREAIISPIPDGTTEIQKLLIARALNGVSAFR